jgi:S-adenosylmethionine:tRNA ribosyltransferase-isomerase
MHISAFEYHLPPELIAQQPAPNRDESRMLILNRRTGEYRDSVFANFPYKLEPGSIVVINNTRVFPARLIGQRRGHRGRIEVLLLREVERGVWEALVKPGRVMREGTGIVFGKRALRGRVIQQLEEGRRLIRFDCDPEELDRIIDQIGCAPLPPYIKRHQPGEAASDRERYQTVYAKHRGAIAAPTAGLHFTERIFQKLRERDIEMVELTHHVGYGTFQPVRVERIEEHHIEAEQYHISEETAERINQARREHRPVVAVGTTCVRALESAADAEGFIQSGHAWTELFIYPGYCFRVVDQLLTNFHLPRSTLLMLVCAVAGRENVLQAYQHAVEERYRFYSFGDCMLIK